MYRWTRARLLLLLGKLLGALLFPALLLLLLFRLLLFTFFGSPPHSPYLYSMPSSRFTTLLYSIDFPVALLLLFFMLDSPQSAISYRRYILP